MRTALASIARPLIARRSIHLAATARPAFVAATQQRQQRVQPSSLAKFQQLRFASSSSLSKDDITKRIMDILKSFQKVDPTKLTAESSFTNDLGLDSLDAVEVVMAIEEEFSIEIPDEEADAISTIGQAIDYISKTPEAH